MKSKLIILLAIIIGGLAGSWIKNLPGFIIIAYDKTTYEMRLWIAVCLLLLILLVLVLTFLLVRSLLSNAGRVKNWHSGRHGRKARKLTTQGMLAFTEGRWKDSEDAMVNAAKKSDTKLINYLIAAQAAQHQNAVVRRDSYLRLAYQAEPAAKIAIGLTQAQLQLQHKQFEQALASLNELKTKNPQHPYVLKLLCNLFCLLQEWEQLILLLPNLKKYSVLEAEALTSIEHQAVSGLLKKQAKEGQVEALQDTWLNLPSHFRKSKTNLISYAELLINFKQMDEAENILKPIIKKQADSEVIKLYGKIEATHSTKQLSFLENWFNANQNPPEEIYLTLGKLAFNAKLWGKSRQFLETAIKTSPSAEAYLYMAKTLHYLDDDKQASIHYQKGLELFASPQTNIENLALPKGSEDLVVADLLPKFQKIENKV